MSGITCFYIMGNVGAKKRAYLLFHSFCYVDTVNAPYLISYYQCNLFYCLMSTFDIPCLVCPFICWNMSFFAYMLFLGPILLLPLLCNLIYLSCMYTLYILCLQPAYIFWFIFNTTTLSFLFENNPTYPGIDLQDNNGNI